MGQWSTFAGTVTSRGREDNVLCNKEDEGLVSKAGRQELPMQEAQPGHTAVLAPPRSRVAPRVQLPPHKRYVGVLGPGTCRRSLIWK